jgi:hypothetical protein
MKRFLTLILGLGLSLTLSSVQAKTVQGSFSFSDFSQAQETAHLTWIVESTKVGLFSSDVYGYVLNYEYRGDLDEKTGVLKNLTLSFPILAMNSDSESRDTKLHTLCMGSPTYDKIKVVLPGPISVKEQRKRVYQGQAYIRGKVKPFTIKAMAQISEADGKKVLHFKGKSIWSLQKMEIPDPSIAVAKLSDAIRINFNIPHTFKEP